MAIYVSFCPCNPSEIGKKPRNPEICARTFYTSAGAVSTSTPENFPAADVSAASIC